MSDEFDVPFDLASETAEPSVEKSEVAFVPVARPAPKAKPKKQRVGMCEHRIPDTSYCKFGCD